MARRLLLAAGAAALGAALVLGGCPLPQPLPEYASVDGGTLTSLRFRLETIQPSDPVVYVAKDCPDGARFRVSLSLDDPDPLERVEARWFVNYRAGTSTQLPIRMDDVPPADDPNDPSRRDIPALGVPAFTFEVPRFDPASPGRPPDVLELVACSVGFVPYGQDPPGTPYPYRTPQLGYPTAQVYRWVFQYVDAGGRCQ